MSDENTKGSSPVGRSGDAGRDALRPAGKRQVTGTAAANRTEAKDTRSREVSQKGRGPVGFVKGVGSELSKVIWPTGREMVTYTIVVLVFLVAITALCAGVDFGTGKGVEFMFGV